MASVSDILRQVPPADRRKLLFEVAKSILDEQPEATPVVIGEGDAPPIGYLFRIPPMPESDQTPEEEAAEDAWRLATLDDTVTLDEMLAMLDFGAAARSAQS
jgi:hypothetical protein